MKMWEIVACPVADVTAFLENPLRCMFGLNEESQSDGNLLDVFSSIDGTAILGAMTDSIVPLAVEFVYNFSGLAWLEKVSSMFELTFFANIFEALIIYSTHLLSYIDIQKRV